MSLLHTNKTKAYGKAEASSISLLLALIFISCFLCSCTVYHTMSHCCFNYIRCLFADWLSLSVDTLSVCSHVCLQYNVHALQRAELHGTDERDGGTDASSLSSTNHETKNHDGRRLNSVRLSLPMFHTFCFITASSQRQPSPFN